MAVANKITTTKSDATTFMKIILNAIIAKPEGMGGFNVTKNFYLKTLEDKENDWYYFVSDAFDKEMKGRENGIDEEHYFVFPTQPDFKHFFSGSRMIRQAEDSVQPDIVYSILAPSYHRFKATEVMRCANAWTVVGGVNKYALKVTPLKYRLRYFLKAWLTRFQMRHTKYFITQTEVAKKCILRSVKTSPENVCVVSNVLPEKYSKVEVNKVEHKGFNMVYITSPAVHKDYLLLPEVASILIRKYGIKDFKIHVTVPDNCNELFLNKQAQYNVHDYFVNHGFLNLDGLVKCYLQSDMGLFPSLLETFSATLLEYMYFQLPIVASDLDFNREVAKEAALYFEPHNPEDMAAKIYQAYSNDSIKQHLLEQATGRLSLFCNNANKFAETVRFLDKIVYLERR